MRDFVRAKRVFNSLPESWKEELDQLVPAMDSEILKEAVNYLVKAENTALALYIDRMFSHLMWTSFYDFRAVILFPQRPIRSGACEVGGTFALNPVSTVPYNTVNRQASREYETIAAQIEKKYGTTSKLLASQTEVHAYKDTIQRIKNSYQCSGVHYLHDDVISLWTNPLPVEFMFTHQVALMQGLTAEFIKALSSQNIVFPIISINEDTDEFIQRYLGDCENFKILSDTPEPLTAANNFLINTYSEDLIVDWIDLTLFNNG